METAPESKSTNSHQITGNRDKNFEKLSKRNKNQCFPLVKSKVEEKKEKKKKKKNRNSRRDNYDKDYQKIMIQAQVATDAEQLNTCEQDSCVEYSEKKKRKHTRQSNKHSQDDQITQTQVTTGAQQQVSIRERDSCLECSEADCFCSSGRGETCDRHCRTGSNLPVPCTESRPPNTCASRDASQVDLSPVSAASMSVSRRERVSAGIDLPVVQMRQEAADQSTPPLKKQKLSSSLIGRGTTKAKKGKKKVGHKESCPKKRTNHQLATTVKTINNRLRAFAVDTVPTTAHPSSADTVSCINTSIGGEPNLPQLKKKKKKKKSSKKNKSLTQLSRSLGAPTVGVDSVPAAAVSPFSTDVIPNLAQFVGTCMNFLLPPPLSHPTMSVDRSRRRDTGGSWSSSDSLVKDNFGSYNRDWVEGQGLGGGLFTDFSQDWPEPCGAAPFMNRSSHSSNAYKWQKGQNDWQQGDSRNWYGSNEGPPARFQNSSFHGGRGGYNQGWNSWGPDNQGWQDEDNFVRPQSVGSGNQARQQGSKSQWDQSADLSFPERSERNSQWQNLTRQFGSSHFHREGANSQERGHSDSSHAAESSGLEDSGGSGGGRKRPRSLDTGGQVSKSSKAENPTSYDFYGLSRNRASSVSDHSRAEFQKPDSTSRKIKAPKPEAMTGKGSKSGSGSGTSAGGLGVKKKQTVAKNKAASTSSVSGTKTTEGAAIAGEVDGGDSEGVLEKAERMCKELREKRKQKQAAPSRASLNAQRAGQLRSVLNTAVNNSRFNLVHKSFLRDYMSDSSSTTKKSAADDTRKKQVSASTTSEAEQPARSVDSACSSVDSGADSAASSARSSQPAGSDIDRIRHSIENSVMAEGRVRRTSVGERSSSGGRSAAPSLLSSSSHLPTTSSVTVSASSLSNKPPLPLSKDALAKMVNAPRSRTQRLQLARIFRQHSAAAAVQPRRIQLDGLYDNDGDSFGDVLKNISGLEEIGECAELKSIKLEDLTCEDKLRIAQMIEEADSGSRPHHTDVIDLGEETSMSQRSHLPHRARLPSSDAIIQETEPSAVISRSRSPLRSRTASPSPSRPLSLDDLNTEDRSRRESSTDAIFIPPRSVDPCTSTSIVTSLRSGSPTRPGSPARARSAALVHSSSPRSSRTHAMSPRRSVEVIEDRSEVPPLMHAVSPQRSMKGLGYSGDIPPLTHALSPPRRSVEGVGDSGEVPPLTHALSPPRRSVEGVGDSGEDPPLGDTVDSASIQTESSAGSDRLSGRSVPVPMDISDASTLRSPTRRPASPEAGVLHEVRGLCQRQDSILTDMRDIDNELCTMYKSLIEVVARMSGLQRRRVQLQTESEELSQRRNDLLNGLYPHAAVTWDRGPLSAAGAERQAPPMSSDPAANPAPSIQSATESEQQSVSRGCERGEQPQAASGSLVTLPTWLTASTSSSSSRPAAAEKSGSRGERTPSSSSERSGEVCLSGSVTSTVVSAAPHALSQGSSLNNSVDSVREAAPRHTAVVNNARPSSSDLGERAGRVMLSINGAVDSAADRNVTASSLASFAMEASHCAEKSRVGADSSSGIGSSVSTQRKSMGSPLSDSGTLHNLSSTQSSQEEQNQSVQPAESSRLLIHSFTSPNPPLVNSGQSPSVNQPKSPGVSVAYLGAISSDLVQQIVRNLPLTSQLGEVNKPAMYMVRPGTSAMDISSENQSRDARARSASVEDSAAKSQTRTTSQHSISSDLSSGEPVIAEGIPPLKLHDDSLDKAGSKPCTPRSESDGHSISSGTSLGEQIKLFSERNSFSQQDTPTGQAATSTDIQQGSHEEEDDDDDDDDNDDDKSGSEMPDCSVVLERLDMDRITIIPDPCRVAEEEADKRKKRKSRKDRDQSLQRRRRYMRESSSEGEEDGERTPVGDGGSSPTSPAGQPQPPSVEKMEADCGAEDNEDSTVVGSVEQPLSQDLVSEEGEARTAGSSLQAASSTGSAVSASRLKLNPENLKTFRANVRRNLVSPPPGQSSAGGGEATAGENQPGTEERRVAATKESVMKISGPCTPVTGLCVHNKLLYACFQRIGVNSYTMKGKLSAEYPQTAAQCFALTPVGSGSQHYLAVGSANCLTFHSISDQSVVSQLDTEFKVTCMQVIDASLFAGLDSGEVIVVSLTTLQETRRFQASDFAVQCLAWTREGSTRLLTLASQDAHIHVIDAGTGLPVRIIGGHTKTAFSLFMCDHTVISGSGDRKVMAHNVHNASFMWELQDHKGIITSVCVDNGLLFTAGYDKIIRCYDLKSRKLLHLMYGAGKCVIMKMAIHNSILYTGNRDGEIEAIDLRDMGSFACECASCSAVYGLKDHLWHHLVTDHVQPNTQAMRCPWARCSVMLDTRSALGRAGEHLHRHINGSL